MKENKNRNFKLFFIIIWCLIAIFSFTLLINSYLIFNSKPSDDEVTVTVQSNIITVACNFMIKSNIPILDYISNEGNHENNVILNSLAGLFPINRYIAEAKIVTDESTDEKQNSPLLTNGFNLLFSDNEKQNSNNSNTDINTYNNSSESSPEEDNNSLLPGGETEDGDILYPDQGSEADENMTIDIIDGEVYLEDETTEDGSGTDMDTEAEETLGTINGEYFTKQQLLNRQFLYKNFYIIDSETAVSDDLFDAVALLGKDMKMELNPDEPQILIYHTHSQETYSDSRAGVEEDTVVGIGNYLTDLLTDKYGFNVIHDKSKYDLMEGYLERNLAYNHASEGISKILEDNPSIEVVIDLHRDGVSESLPKGEGKRLSSVNGKEMAQLMFFNGLSRDSKGEIERLKNSYLQDNLAFSLQLQLKGREMYPGLMFKNYLHAYRYNMQYRKKSLLVETGTNRNTLEEARNSMEPLADILYEVLVGE